MQKLTTPLLALLSAPPPFAAPSTAAVGKALLTAAVEEYDEEAKLERDYADWQANWDRRTARVQAHLRPRHRNAYNWLLNEMKSVALGLQMEHSMSSYTGRFCYACEQSNLRAESSFGAQFGSVRKFFHEVHALYGWEALQVLGAWELPSMPSFLYARMMDEAHADHLSGLPPF